MIETEVFFALIAAATALTLLTLRVSAPSFGPTLARGLFHYSILIGLAVVAVTIGRVAGLVPAGAVPPLLFKILIYRVWVPVGAGLAAVVLIAMAHLRSRPPSGASANSFATSSLLVQALCVSIALAFLAVEIGKLTHDAEMRQFFRDSGLPVWGNYAVIGAELLGAGALLWRRSRILAALGLSALMIGAIGTHARNGDPFTDSLEALHLLIMLSCVTFLTGASWMRTGSTHRNDGARNDE